MKEKLVFRLGLMTLVLSVALSVYALLGKGEAVPPVYMVMHGSSYNYEESDKFNKELFWDNYPYWVLLSRGKDFPGSFSLTDSRRLKVPFSQLVASSDSVFFRFHYHSLDDAELFTIMDCIRRSELKASIITDEASISILQTYNGYRQIKDRIYTTGVMLPVSIDQSGLPYFFRMDEHHKVQDIFIPRPEILEITSKYLSYQAN